MATLAIDRLLAQIVEEDHGFSTPCRVWKGSGLKNGYGTISTRSESTRRNALVHRIAYVGRGEREIPDDLTIDHLCHVKRCCNPDHMELVTREENGRRGYLKQCGMAA